MRPFSIHNRRTPGPIVTVPAGEYSHYALDPADASVSLTFNPDGTTSVSAGASPSSASNWKNSFGAGADFDISFDGGGSWLNLGTARTIGVSRAFIGITTSNISCRIRATGGATLDSGVLSLTAEVDG